MQKILNTDEIERIEQAVKKVEQESSAEFVTVIAQKSNRYAYIPHLWASLIALFIPGLICWALNLYLGPYVLYEIQLLSFIFLSLLFRVERIKMHLIPKTVRRRRASRFAFQQFYEQRIYCTKERTGLLFFVSLAEKHVEIIADAGIYAKVPKEEIDAIIQGFIEAVKSGKIADGFTDAITQCGKMLKEHFPAKEGDSNELPDRLVLL